MYPHRTKKISFGGKTQNQGVQEESATKRGDVGQNIQSAQIGEMYPDDRLHDMYDTG